MIKKSWFSDYNIAVFTLVFMSVQFLFVEGGAVSMPKVACMVLTPVLWLWKSPYITKATILSILFWGVTVGMSVVQFGTPRMSTFYYTLLFLCMFNLYYNLVNVNRVFTIDSFLKVVQGVIFSYAICLVLQQICILVGAHNMPLVNLVGQRYLELFRLNTLAIEPSHAARILTVYFYALLKLSGYKYGRMSMKEFYALYKWAIVAFLYTMIMMGSGTAFVGLAILSLYFLRKQYVGIVLVAGFAFYMAVPFIDYEPFNRAVAVFNVALEGDTELMKQTDHSASSRVNIIIDTFKYLDVMDIDTWLGTGVDGWMLQEKAVLSAVTDYGLISYILKLVLFFSCCFTGLFTLEVLIFILMLSMNVGNIAYGWAILMVFATVRFLKNNNTPLCYYPS